MEEIEMVQLKGRHEPYMGIGYGNKQIIRKMPRNYNIL
jgi:hypothetical protein